MSSECREWQAGLDEDVSGDEDLNGHILILDPSGTPC